MKLPYGMSEREILGKYIKLDTLAHALKNVMKIELMCSESQDYEKSGSEVVDELEKVLEKIKSM